MRAEYSQQESALAEKARTQGVGSLSEAEQKEWIAARSALTELDSQKNLSLHRAQTIGSSVEVSAETTNVMGHAAIVSEAGAAEGISKGGANGSKNKVVIFKNYLTDSRLIILKRVYMIFRLENGLL
ncbi:MULTISPECIES: hypothetical protein [Pantoea]|jgi:hypothetical protein|uniref:hypothetical protein n=1 Tax=Pantoea TaxID=53335 RepID=UPI00142E21DE|nr:hypothetical protein [Pantoea sp. EKM101V]KAF6668667.1 hypothetical protein HFD92_00090 [Pantoea sp. EKM101V]